MEKLNCAHGVDLADYRNDHEPECRKCPYSLICITGRDQQARLIERWFCDRCSRYWVRLKGTGIAYRCTRNMGTFNINPRPWVCWDCVDRAMENRKVNISGQFSR